MMKAILVSSIQTLFKRFKTATFLNIVGLSTAFVVLTIIIIQSDYERSFDKMHANASRIYRVDKKDNSGFSVIHARGMIEALIKSSPQIEAGTLLNGYTPDIFFTVGDSKEQKGYKEDFVMCHADITKIFGFDMLEGTKECLNDPQNIIIPESMAKRLFHSESAINKHINLQGLLWNKQDGGPLRIGGVYKDFPENTQLNNSIYTRIADDYSVNDWNSNSYIAYLLLDKNISPQDIADNFNTNIAVNRKDEDNESIEISLTPITSIYYLNESQDGNIIKSGSKSTTLILLSIAFLVTLVAIINFTNFSMAMAPMRIRNINTRKVLGSTSAALRIELILEAIMISLLSFIIAVVAVFLIDKQNIFPFVKADINPLNNPFALTISLIVALLTGVMASLRPAFHTTSIPPALALRGSFGLSPAGKKLRTTLVGFQFLISIILISTSIFISKQNSYMQDYSLGFDKDQIAIVAINPDMPVGKKKKYVNQLKSNPHIEDVAFAQQKLGSSDSYRQQGVQYKDERIPAFSISVSWNFLDVMGIKILEGRSFSEEDTESNLHYHIVNKNIHDIHGISLGDFFTYGWDKDKRELPIIGVCDNIQINSLRNEFYNTVFVINETRTKHPYSYVRIKAGADIKQVVSHIEKTIRDIDTTYPFKLEFYDSIFDQLYKREMDMAQSISVFSMLAILISIVGVFGMVAFECQYRRKEISIRKVLGSTVKEVLVLFNKTYLVIFAVCFIISIPITYYIVHSWLQNFKFKISIDWWLFIIVAIPILLFILATVSLQSYRAATANPIEALKNE